MEQKQTTNEDEKSEKSAIYRTSNTNFMVIHRIIFATSIQVLSSFGRLFGFYGILTFVGYLMPHSFLDK